MNLKFNISESAERNNIAVFFLSSMEKNNNKYLSLSEAMDANQVQISDLRR